MSNEETKKDNHTFAKVAAGAALVGGVVAAAVLSNKENRDNLKEGVNNAVDKAQEKGEEVVDAVKQKATETKDRAIEMAMEEYNTLKAKLEDYITKVKNDDETKQLQKSADEIGESIKKAKSQGENVAEDLVENIKKSLEDLNKNMEKLQKEKTA